MHNLYCTARPPYVLPLQLYKSSFLYLSLWYSGSYACLADFPPCDSVGVYMVSFHSHHFHSKMIQRQQTFRQMDKINLYT